MRIFFIALLLLLIPVHSQGIAATVYFEREKISVDFDENWSESPSSDALLVIRKFDSNGISAELVLSRITVASDFSVERRAEVYASHILAEYEVEPELEDVTVGEQPGKRLRFSSQKAGDLARVLIYIFGNDDRFYTITARGASVLSDGEFEPVVASIRFLDSAPARVCAISSGQIRIDFPVPEGYFGVATEATELLHVRSRDFEAGIFKEFTIDARPAAGGQSIESIERGLADQLAESRWVPGEATDGVLGGSGTKVRLLAFVKSRSVGRSVSMHLALWKQGDKLLTIAMKADARDDAQQINGNFRAEFLSVIEGVRAENLGAGAVNSAPSISGLDVSARFFDGNADHDTKDDEDGIHLGIVFFGTFAGRSNVPLSFQGQSFVVSITVVLPNDEILFARRVPCADSNDFCWWAASQSQRISFRELRDSARDNDQQLPSEIEGLKLKLTVEISGGSRPIQANCEVGG
ncbi:MAG: hypothetical protein NUW37_11240 [Planctomycetes bacterium]|nr:hypothetical protein [Planctomycetota bacterium]